MPSIFIWKSKEINKSKDIIRYYSGSNWFLEENDEGMTRSFVMYDQNVILDSVLDDNVIVFTAKEMKKDWVGSELLEVTQLPYTIIKSDNFGTLEMIGNWYRFITNNETITINQINNWITYKKTDSILNFNSFLIKYDSNVNISSKNIYNTMQKSYKYIHKNNKYSKKYNKSIIDVV